MAGSGTRSAYDVARRYLALGWCRSRAGAGTGRASAGSSWCPHAHHAPWWAATESHALAGAVPGYPGGLSRLGPQDDPAPGAGTSWGPGDRRGRRRSAAASSGRQLGGKDVGQLLAEPVGALVVLAHALFLGGVEEVDDHLPAGTDPHRPAVGLHASSATCLRSSGPDHHVSWAGVPRGSTRSCRPSLHLPAARTAMRTTASKPSPPPPRLPRRVLGEMTRPAARVGASVTVPHRARGCVARISLSPTDPLGATKATPAIGSGSSAAPQPRPGAWQPLRRLGPPTGEGRLIARRQDRLKSRADPRASGSEARRVGRSPT